MAQGNAAFSAGKLDEAVKLFTRCIELDASNHIYHSNRAAAHTGLKDYKAAVRDARWAQGLGAQPLLRRGAGAAVSAILVALQRQRQLASLGGHACSGSTADPWSPCALLAGAARSSSRGGPRAGAGWGPPTSGWTSSQRCAGCWLVQLQCGQPAESRPRCPALVPPACASVLNCRTHHPTSIGAGGV